MKRTLVTLLAFSSISLTHAQEKSPEPRSITVTGNAERILPADRVRVSVAIRSVRDDLAAARNASQEGFAAVVKGLGGIGVPSEKIELTNHSLGREYENGPNGERMAKGFFSARDFVIELDDASLLELVHGNLAENPEVAVNQTSFSRKDEIEVRKDLRKEALSAALEKAGAMAAVYGQEVGRPLKMSEGGGFQAGHFAANRISMPEFGEAGGRVTLEALVEVTFELLD